MNAVEGRIDIDLYPVRGEITRVELESSRPLRASRVMVGKTPAEVLSLLPLMFNVCGVAQARAALCAIQRELGQRPAAADEAARDLLVAVETAREHLLRVFLDWPRLFELEFDNRVLPQIGDLNSGFAASLFPDDSGFSLHSQLRADADGLTRRIAELDSLLAGSVFGMPAGEWLEISGLADLEAWLESCDSVAARATAQIQRRGWSAAAPTAGADLPEISDADLLDRFGGDDAERFIEFPEWGGRCYETTPLSRQRQQPLVAGLTRELGRGLLVRWIARLVELASVPARLVALRHALREAGEQLQPPAPAGAGIAQVEAARGRLVHRVRIDGDRVADYRILAPTEWNFHPRGIIGESLAQLTDVASLESCARAVINAIDPCVGYRLRVH